jgi:hypothetical protein
MVKQDIQTITYPGAYHNFDFARPATYAPAVRSGAGCHGEVNLDEQSNNRSLGERRDSLDRFYVKICQV